MAQIAPVVLFPIFYKFEPFQNEDLKARLVRLSEKAGTRVRGVYKWKLSEKSNKANAALTGLSSGLAPWRCESLAQTSPTMFHGKQSYPSEDGARRRESRCSSCSPFRQFRSGRVRTPSGLSPDSEGGRRHPSHHFQSARPSSPTMQTPVHTRSWGRSLRSKVGLRRTPLAKIRLLLRRMPDFRSLRLRADRQTRRSARSLRWAVEPRGLVEG